MKKVILVGYEAAQTLQLEQLLNEGWEEHEVYTAKNFVLFVLTKGENDA